MGSVTRSPTPRLRYPTPTILEKGTKTSARNLGGVDDTPSFLVVVAADNAGDSSPLHADTPTSANLAQRIVIAPRAAPRSAVSGSRVHRKLLEKVRWHNTQ
jgi:hypothetical protein